MGKKVPAWLLSLIVHLLLLILLSLLLRGGDPGLPGEPDRPVAVILAQRSATERVEYFDEADAAAADSAAEQSEQPLVPPPDQAPRLPEITLPGPPRVPLGASLQDQLIHVPDATAGRRPVLPSAGEAEILAADAASRRRPAGPTGPPAKLGIFGGPQVSGHSFVFVIDRSKSMGGSGLGALSAAARQLDDALAQLQPNHKFQILAYHHKPIYVTSLRKLLPATPEHLAEVRRYFRALAAFGATDHETALLAALRLKPDVIYLLTDGGDPYLNQSQIDLIVARAGGQTRIHCIQFGLGALQDEFNFMMDLAGRNQGSYRYVDMSRGY